MPLPLSLYEYLIAPRKVPPRGPASLLQEKIHPFLNTSVSTHHTFQRRCYSQFKTVMASSGRHQLGLTVLGDLKNRFLGSKIIENRSVIYYCTYIVYPYCPKYQISAPTPDVKPLNTQHCAIYLLTMIIVTSSARVTV